MAHNYRVVCLIPYKELVYLLSCHTHTLVHTHTYTHLCIIMVLYFPYNVPSGIPLAPVITGVKLQESSTDKSYNLTISWEARQDEVRPIHIFTGSVVLTPLRHPVAVFDPSNVVYGFTVDNNTNEFTIVDVELAPFYRIEVCARNSLGFTCSDARFYAVVDGSITLIRDGVQEQRDSDLPAGVIVAIVMLVLFVILACCLGFICLLLFFCCCDEWRSYYPESRGTHVYCIHVYTTACSVAEWNIIDTDWLSFFSFPEKKYKRDFERLFFMQNVSLPTTICISLQIQG